MRSSQACAEDCCGGQDHFSRNLILATVLLLVKGQWGAFQPVSKWALPVLILPGNWYLSKYHMWPCRPPFGDAFYVLWMTILLASGLGLFYCPWAWWSTKGRRVCNFDSAMVHDSTDLVGFHCNLLSTVENVSRSLTCSSVTSDSWFSRKIPISCCTYSRFFWLSRRVLTRENSADTLLTDCLPPRGRQLWRKWLIEAD